MMAEGVGNIKGNLNQQHCRSFGSEGKRQSDENKVVRTSLTRNNRFPMEGDGIDAIINKRVLIDKSKKYENETKSFVVAPRVSEERIEQSIEKPTKKPIPLLQRLRVIKASQKIRSNSPRKPLPQEVIVASEDSDGVLPAVTAFSELGVEGVTSVRAFERRTPTRFTFDGVVPSQSSLDEIDVPPDDVVLAKSHSQADKANPAFFPGLEYESEHGTADAESLERESPLKSASGFDDGKERERCRSASTSEMSIELSESEHFRNCESLVLEDKYKIFSPQNSLPGKKRQMPIDHGFETIMESSANLNKKEKPQSEPSSSSPWIDFSFLKLW